MAISDDDLEACIRVLEHFHVDGGLEELQQPRYKQLRKSLHPLLEDLRPRFFHGQTPDAIARKQEAKRQRKIERARQKALDQKHIDNTKLRADRIARLQALSIEDGETPQVPDGVSSTHSKLLENGDAPELHFHRSCYTCHRRFRQLHQFYDSLCTDCANLNYFKRLQTADLAGRIALVTGARVKIGYEIGLKLLRAGATVLATTRFPKDAAKRYASEEDFEEWKHRLQVHGLDFRDLGSIDELMAYVENTFGCLDIVINNATQTVRRPTHYYSHLIEGEASPFPPALHQAEDLVQTTRTLVTQENNIASSVAMSQMKLLEEDEQSEETAALFPKGKLDHNAQQIDLRTNNSWKLKLEEVDTMELVEVFAVNAMAPFILNKRAIPLLEKSSYEQRFIVNVSAMEGKFSRYKTPHHPHTNMAKAAVNMMTKSSAEDLSKRGIYMTSVDTGWINDENPRNVAAEIAAKHNFQTPLDEVDAAARVLDPIFMLHQKDHAGTKPLYGVFLKDYDICEW